MENGLSWKRRRVIACGAVVIAMLAGGAIALALSGDHTTADAEAPVATSPGGDTAAGSSTTRGGDRGAAPSTSTNPRADRTTTAPVAVTPDTRRAPGATVPAKPAPTSRPSNVAADPFELQLAAVYSASFEGQCRAIWAHAGADGKLWDADDDPTTDPHTVDECLLGLDPQGARFFTEVADARQGGINDANAMAEDMTLGNRFRNAAGALFAIP